MREVGITLIFVLLLPSILALDYGEGEFGCGLYGVGGYCNETNGIQKNETILDNITQTQLPDDITNRPNPIINIFQQIININNTNNGVTNINISQYFSQKILQYRLQISITLGLIFSFELLSFIFLKSEFIIFVIRKLRKRE